MKFKVETIKNYILHYLVGYKCIHSCFGSAMTISNIFICHQYILYAYLPIQNVQNIGLKTCKETCRQDHYNFYEMTQ